MKTVIFDLDGTISDPSAGITSGLNHSLEKLGKERLPGAELLRFIGPPLRLIFTELAPYAIEEGIQHFRDYYSRRGFRENTLYPHIPFTLKAMNDLGCRLFIATGKKTSTACQVLDYFRISHFFCEVHGCGHGGTKTELLKTILARWGSNAVMIGDRDTDFTAASEAEIPSIGVKWGFAQPGELNLADATADKPEDLLSLVSRFLEE